MNHLSMQRVALLMLLCAGVFVGAWFDTTHHHVWTEGINGWVTTYLREPIEISTQGQHLYHQVLLGITWLGGNVAFLIAMGFLSIYLAVKKEWKALLYILFTAGVAILVVHVFKSQVHSPRPAPFDGGYESFPSGHVSRSTLWCGLWLCMFSFKQIMLPRYVTKLLIAIPFLVLYSRLALGKHWLSDVVAAYALITFILLGASLIGKSEIFD